MVVVNATFKKQLWLILITFPSFLVRHFLYCWKILFVCAFLSVNPIKQINTMLRILTFFTVIFLTTLSFAQDEAGQLVKSSDFLGKPLVIHFWATWCPYCKKLQPGLDKLLSMVMIWLGTYLMWVAHPPPYLLIKLGMLLAVHVSQNLMILV